MTVLVIVRFTYQCVGSNNDFTFDIVSCKNMNNGTDVLSFLPKQVVDFRSSLLHKSRQVIYTNFEAPSRQLILGMVIGLDTFKETPEYKSVLRRTGTIHVVVVSGFNITLVFTFIERLFSSLYKKKYLFFALLFMYVYAFISGMEPPVVRAVFMSTLYLWLKYNGIQSLTVSILIVSGLLMLLIRPLYVFSLSFWLSMSATFGLVAFSSCVQSFLPRFLDSQNVLVQDMVATISAQVLVVPIIAYFFEELSLVSILVNSLVLWTVPLITVLGMLMLLLGSAFGYVPILPELLNYLTSYFVFVTSTFSGYAFSSVDFSMDLWQLVLYYLVVALAYFRFTGRQTN